MGGGGGLRKLGVERVGSGIHMEQESEKSRTKLQHCVLFFDRGIEERSMNQKITMEGVGVWSEVKGMEGGRFITPCPPPPVFLWCSNGMQDRLM